MNIYAEQGVTFSRLVAECDMLDASDYGSDEPSIPVVVTCDCTHDCGLLCQSNSRPLKVTFITMQRVSCPCSCHLLRCDLCAYNTWIMGE